MRSLESMGLLGEIGVGSVIGCESMSKLSSSVATVRSENLLEALTLRFTLDSLNIPIDIRCACLIS